MDLRIINFILLVVFVLVQAGCATIVSGKTQDVMIRSNPPGAMVKIDEIVTGVTPMMANLVRKKRHVISIQKDGYQEVSHGTTRGFNGWYIGNLLFGGIIGLITDPITGAMYDVEPGELNMNLPLASSTRTIESAAASVNAPAPVAPAQSSTASTATSNIAPAPKPAA